MEEDKKIKIKKENNLAEGSKEHSLKYESEQKREKKDHLDHDGSDHKHGHNEKKEINNINEKEMKREESKDGKKVVAKEKPRIKKEFAVVRAPSVHMSKRHGMYVCSFIKGKNIDKAISELEEVIILKRAIPFKGEIPHRKGDIMSGRYPVAAAKIIIPMLKNLKGAVLFNGMDFTKSQISLAYANFAPRPQRKGGMKGKRAYITIEARELNK
jgi:ribosomal protein L22